MAEFLYSIDLSIFYFFNHTLSSAPLDRFFSIITNVNNWYIAYLILLGISFFKGGIKGKIAAAGIILLILVTDQLNHNIIKELFERIRPCIALSDVITPVGCNGTLSFPSNHAVNNFAAATYFYMLYPKLKIPLFTAAALVALSRVYLGLHYPSDIVAGAVIGALFGYLFAYLTLKLLEAIRKRKET